jgi:RNA polymerase sigma-70 factor (ECF subfamily)
MGATSFRQLPASGRLVDDEPRFRAVFERHYPTVVRALQRVTGDDAEAEDLAQETFVSLGWHRFPAGKAHNLRAWLLRSAINRAFIARRGRLRREGREAAAGLQIVGDRPAPDAHRVRQRVRAVLLDLDERACQLLVLRAVGLSYGELAEVVDVAPSSVGTLLARAHRAFADAYARRHGNLEEDVS